MLKLNIDAKVMLPVNIDLQDRLINGQTGVIRHIEFAEGSAGKVYIKFFDEQDGSEAMRSSYLGGQKSWVPIEKCETEISVKKGERISIAIDQPYSISINISMGIYCS